MCKTSLLILKIMFLQFMTESEKLDLYIMFPERKHKVSFVNLDRLFKKMLTIL